LLAADAAHAAERVVASRYDVLAWPKASVSDFGCFLEKTFAYKDAKFNCSLKNYQAVSDPCKHQYDEGLDFPDKFAARIHPLVKRIELNWEHGQLQAVTFEFGKKIDAQFVKAAFGLDLNSINSKNVMSADIQDCTLHGACLMLQGFDHLGAGDVDCPPHRKGR
ncbi:MAG: hypothetical protein K2X55_26755, partial [Burkholderiaceae bacterium]|nr:hypothetical protein [Burkholderiaceae bacterium]